MSKNQFLNLLAFCILMGNEKILSKAPSYIMEKFYRYVNRPNIEKVEFLWGLDANNREIFDEYVALWVNEISSLENERTHKGN